MALEYIPEWILLRPVWDDFQNARSHRGFNPFSNGAAGPGGIPCRKQQVCKL